MKAITKASGGLKLCNRTRRLALSSAWGSSLTVTTCSWPTCASRAGNDAWRRAGRQSGELLGFDRIGPELRVADLEGNRRLRFLEHVDAPERVFKDRYQVAVEEQADDHAEPTAMLERISALRRSARCSQKDFRLAGSFDASGSTWSVLMAMAGQARSIRRCGPVCQEQTRGVRPAKRAACRRPFPPERPRRFFRCLRAGRFALSSRARPAWRIHQFAWGAVGLGGVHTIRPR